MKKSHFDIFAATAPGLEFFCAAELAALGVADARVVPGGVEFSGELSLLYRANLWLRTATRLLVRVGEFRCRDFPRLYQKALRLPWGRFLRPGSPFEIRASSRGSRLVHTDRLAQTVSEAIVRCLGPQAEPVADAGRQKQLVLVRMHDDLCRVSVDSSGELLHRRGYRQEAGPAPLRETLAAAMLMSLGWEGTVPLLDPFCGSGTIAIEAGLLASQRPPGEKRSFAFMQWPRYRPGLWQALLLDAYKHATPPTVAIGGSDRDAAVIGMARRNAERAGLDRHVELQVREVSKARASARSGLLLCNPPYGERLDAGVDLVPLYRELGAVYRRHFAGWRLAFICPDPRLASRTGLSLAEHGPFINGGLRVHLYEADGVPFSS